MDFGKFLFVIAPLIVAGVFQYVLDRFWVPADAPSETPRKSKKRDHHADAVDGEVDAKLYREQERREERDGRPERFEWVERERRDPRADKLAREPSRDEPEFEMPGDFHLAEYSGRTNES